MRSTRDVHRHEGDVDVLQRLHLGHALGDAGQVDPLAAQRDDVAVGFALRMLRRARLDVVGGNRLDTDARGRRRLAVGEHDAVRDPRLAVRPR